MKKSIDYGLYLVTDRSLSLGRPIEDVISAAIRGGVTIVQLREKDCSTREYIKLAKRVKSILKPFNIPLIINDRVDVALVAGADGVHVGQSDIPYKDARRLLGPDAIVGLSVETLEQALEAEELDADYLGVSAIFATPTKTNISNIWGIEGLRKLRSHSRHILVGIGGINTTNAESVMKAGADGLAVVSAICSAPDPEEISRQLRSIVDKVRKERKKI